MPLDANFISAFIVGLMGGVHCVGMCGGIVAALSLGVSPSAHEHKRTLLPILLAYNGGRLLSYTVAGVLVGGLGAALASLMPIHIARLVLQLFAGLFMLALGLYLAGWWRGLLRLERIGAHVWKYLEPLGRGWLPVTRARHAFMLGLLWGWLPCGLVYSVLIWALSSGSAANGGMLMFAFGLGTLPLLITMGIWSARLSALMQQRWLRYLAGALVMAYGIIMLSRSVAGFVDWA
jgi:sulfite exporter TauE/SafE